MGLKYIGDGAFVPPYPARDLSDDEVKEYGVGKLLETGLYVSNEAPQPKAPKSAKTQESEA